MPRVGWIEYGPAGFKLPVMFTERSQTFSCTFATTRYEDTQFGALREKVLKAIHEAYAVEWLPVILLTFKGATRKRARDTSYEQAMLYLLRERKYLAFHQEFGCKQANWEAPPERRLQGSTSFLFFEVGEALALPARKSTIEGDQILLPYSEDLWNALGEIQDYLQVASTSIGAHLSTSESILLLVEQCRRLFDHAATSAEEEE